MSRFDRRIFVPEAIDTDDGDSARMQRTYAHLALINRWLSRMRGLLAEVVLDDVARSGGSARVLEVGCGGGDVLAWLARAGARRGLHLHLRGVDADPRAVTRARATLMRYGNVTVEQGTIAELGERIAPADYVFCNHVLHHVPPDAVVPVLRRLRASARRSLLVNDLERSALAYGLYTALAGLLFHRSHVWSDGRLSIRKGFRLPELTALCREAGFPAPTRIERRFPWRVVIVAPGS